MARLTGRKVLITGGASGIGFATAKLFRQEGADVAVLDRTAGSWDGIFAQVDVADAASVQQAVRSAEPALGGLDGVVNAAGIFSAAGLADTTPELFSRTLAVNLLGTFLVVQATAPILLKGGSPATIFNIGSGVGITPTGPGSTAYVASKGGVIAMTKALAMELAPTVRVNVVCPGAVDTPMTQSFLRDASGAVDPGIANRYALRRAADPEELAAAILFLTAADSSFVTGIALPVDGGRTFH
ncbi:MAG TPA: SDR family NAD(P)-dependent oxidoreductase [Rhodopila sp.]|nr:SDR family NAD(P)-dependent oxidoreductase [Rhodopila sp.]